MNIEKLNGPIRPEDTLEYLNDHPETIIVQVNSPERVIEPGFKGALWIPHEEMEKRFEEIPSGHPVLLHCRAGIACIPAYQVLSKKRPDLELGYIAGSPFEIIEEYNKEHQA